MENPTDTLTIQMNDSEGLFDLGDVHFESMRFAFDENDQRLLFSDDVSFKIRKSEDNEVKLNIRKDSHGTVQLQSQGKGQKYQLRI